MAVPWLLIAVLGLAVNEVSCQTENPERDFAAPPPLPTKGVRLFQGVLDRVIPNYAMLAARDFSDRDGGSEGLGDAGLTDGLNDGVWCQSAMNVSGIGSWKLPNGSAVSDDLEFDPIHMANRPGQVGLLRSAGIGSSPYQGMYTCTIPDENGATQTLVVWAAGNGAYDGTDDNPTPDPLVTAVSFIPSTMPRDTDPPEFTLSFKVMVAPPTNVTCQVDSTPVDVAVLSREVTDGQYLPPSTASPVTNVNVTLRTRLAGSYQCTVSVFRANMEATTNDLVDAETSPIIISVTETPTDVTHGSTKDLTVQLSWSAPASNMPPVAGYEVFYAVSSSNSAQSGGTTNNTTISVTLPELDVMYDLFVVAFSDADNALPSARSSNISIKLETIIDPPPTTSPSGTMETGNTSPGETPETTPSASGGSSGAAIAGAIIAVLVVIAIVVIVVVIVVMVLKRRQTTTHEKVGGKKHEAVHYSKGLEEGNGLKSAAKPVIESFPSNMKVAEGQRVEFKVFVRGNPSPSYQWYHDNELIEEDYAHEITEKGSLIIVTAEQKHNGTYMLVAENMAGVAKKYLTLSIIKEQLDDDTTPPVTNGVSTPVRVSLDAVPMAEFGQFVAKCHADNNRGFRNLYASLNGREGEHPATVAITPANKPANRFANITAYDDNRIVLQPMPDCQGDYINASYINGYSLQRKYIATQGPMKKTVVDFWRMVWQEKVQTIIMVTNLKEGDKVKCHQYWPEVESQSFGPFSVTLTEQQVFTDYVIRTLFVKLSNSSESPHRVFQYHFTSWPDHGVPEYATPILSLHRQIKHIHKPKRGPMLIHCSAGVGRTGTFIAIDMALDKVENEGVVDVSNIIVEMRGQRMKMVQTVDQFVFICDAVLESITCGNTQILAADLQRSLSKLRTADPQTGKTGFQQQFDVLTQVSPNPAEVKSSIAAQYPDRNRTLQYAPPDKHRVPLKGSSPDYINATFINGYKQKKAFIIAQSPMDSTCRDFWKMVVDRGCGVIIMLCHTKENGKQTCAQYWPTSNTTKNFGEFVVDALNEVEYPGFIERTLSVSDKKAGGEPHKVLQFHVTNWESSGHCQNFQTIISVQEEMYKVQRRTGNKPVVVHCSDTVSRSGMFCAIATVIDCCKTGGLVDIFQVIKAQRIQKPGLVPNVVQYELIFNAILAYINSFETYTNFQ